MLTYLINQYLECVIIKIAARKISFVIIIFLKSEEFIWSFQDSNEWKCASVVEQIGLNELPNVWKQEFCQEIIPIMDLTQFTLKEQHLSLHSNECETYRSQSP